MKTFRCLYIHSYQLDFLSTVRTVSSDEQSYSMLNLVNTGMDDYPQAGKPPRYRSTQPCSPLRSLNRVPALIGWGKGENVTSTSTISIWHASFHCSEE